MKVLILEDEEIIREYFTVLVQQVLGVKAVEATGSGTQALEMIAAFAPDLTLLDYELQGQEKDGLQIAGEIMRLAPTIYTVLVSGYPPEYFAGQAVKPHGFLVKPIKKADFQSLIARFAEQINHQSSASSAGK